MDKVYICIGSTGEYSDHREWYVKAFANEVKCKDFVDAVSAAYRVVCPKGDWTYGEPKRHEVVPNSR